VWRRLHAHLQDVAHRRGDQTVGLFTCNVVWLTLGCTVYNFKFYSYFQVS